RGPRRRREAVERARPHARALSRLAGDLPLERRDPRVLRDVVGRVRIAHEVARERAHETVVREQAFGIGARRDHPGPPSSLVPAGGANRFRRVRWWRWAPRAPCYSEQVPPTRIRRLRPQPLRAHTSLLARGEASERRGAIAMEPLTRPSDVVENRPR